jgi:hypothetical protein
MQLDWRKVSDDFYTATLDGSLLELEYSDGVGWHLFSPLVDHAGVGFLGEDLHSAMHLAVALLSANYRVHGWTVNGANVAGLAWGPVGDYGHLDLDGDGLSIADGAAMSIDDGAE